MYFKKFKSFKIVKLCSFTFINQEYKASYTNYSFIIMVKKIVRGEKMKLEYIACGIIIFIVCYVAYKIYEFCYYRSEKFKIIKNKAEKYVNECNELNEYIEYLKNSLLSNSNIENGVSHFTDTSRFNYKRPQYNKIRFAPHICNCSRTVCDGSRKRPFQYLCKYFNIRAVEEDLSKLEQMLINF